MNVVSCYRAAQIAQVTKQNISLKKQINVDDKSKYRYFAFDKNTGDFGVDLDHKEWKAYMIKRRSSRSYDKSLENVSSNNTNSKLSQVNNPDLVNKTAFAKAVVGAIKEQYGSNGAELKKLLTNISKRYEGMM